MLEFWAEMAHKVRSMDYLVRSTVTRLKTCQSSAICHGVCVFLWDTGIIDARDDDDTPQWP